MIKIKMSQMNILSNSLLACPNCIKVLYYYDYLSHIEICNANNINNVNNDVETEIDNEYNEYNEEYNNEYFNNINSGIVTEEDLYNSMIDRNFVNESNDITTNNSVNDIANDIGLGIENLSLYSTKIPINNDSYCVICMNTNVNIANTQNTFYLMKCMHSFCDYCSRKWFDFKATCPLCKTNMRKI